MLVANEKWLPKSGKQTADTKWKKTAETTSKPQTVAYLQA